jgi:3-phenylpropionate/trans-cinnamate dioxygenase ferredoxin subunit
MAKHVVARVEDIPEGSRLLITVQGRSVGVFNVGGEFFALLNRCPHKGAELCKGSIVADITATAPGEIRHNPSRRMIQCPWHGWEYDIRTGQSYFDARVRPYPVEVARGDALVQGAEEAGTPTVEGDRAIFASGSSGHELKPGPFKAEVFPLTIEDDYLVLEMPGAARRRVARDC